MNVFGFIVFLTTHTSLISVYESLSLLISGCRDFKSGDGAGSSGGPRSLKGGHPHPLA